MRLRSVSLALGALVLVGLVAGIVGLVVFVAGDAKSPEEAALDKCRGLADQHRFEEARVECDRAIEEDGEFVEAHVQRASVNAALGRFQEAYDDADGALKIDKDSSSALAARARARVALGEFTLAKGDVDRAEEGSVDTPLEWMRLAEAYRSLGMWQAAEENASRACNSGLATACAFSPVPTREQAIDILDHLALTRYDVPRLVPSFSGYHTAAESRSRYGLGSTTRFNEWGFLLSYAAYFYDPSAEAALSSVYSEVWLMDDTSRIHEFFDEITSFLAPSAAEIVDLAQVGDDSIAYSFEGFEGDDTAAPAFSHVVIFRRGPYIAFVTTTFAGAADENETADLARTIDGRLMGE